MLDDKRLLPIMGGDDPPEDASAAEIADLKRQLADKDRELEDEKLQRETTERLLNNPELMGRTRRPPGERVVEERPVADRTELDTAISEVISKLGDEDIRDPAVLAKLLREYGSRIMDIALNQAYGKSLETMQKVVQLYGNTQSVVSAWREKHPDLVEHEKIVEYFLYRETSPRDSLAKRMDDAAELARDFIGQRRQEGKIEEKKENERISRASRVLTPSRGSATPRKEKEETPKFTPEEQEAELSEYLKMRRAERDKRLVRTPSKTT